MTKKRKFLKRIFALVGVVAILFCVAMPLGAVEFDGISFVNYFDVSQFSRDDLRSFNKRISSVDAGSSSFVVNTDAYYSGDGSILTKSTFGAYCSCHEGDTLFLNMDISNGVAPNEGIVRGIYFVGVDDGYWAAGTSKTITQEMLDARFYVYGYNATVAGSVDYAVDTTILISVCLNKNNRYLPYSVYSELYTYTENTYQDGYASGNSVGYQNGYNEGYNTGYDEGNDIGYSNGYDKGKDRGYREYVMKYTILNQYESSVYFYWDSRQYVSSDDLAKEDDWTFPVYITSMNNELYPFDGFSFDTSLITKEMTNFDGELKSSSGQFFDGLCGVQVILKTSSATEKRTVAKDLPLMLSFGDEYDEFFDLITVQAVMPAGYVLPQNAVKVDEDLYVITATVTAHNDEDGVFSYTLQELFGLEAETPIQSLSVKFWSSYSDVRVNDIEKSKSVVITNSANDPSYIAGVTAGKNQGIAQGRDEGYAQGLKDGEKNGYNTGYNDGKIVGYNEGYKAGIDVGELTFTGLITAVVDAPVSVFASMFNFEVLGVNLLNFLTSILSVMIVFAVVKVVISVV